MQTETPKPASFHAIEDGVRPTCVSPLKLDHELRNPLAAIRALSEIVRDNPDMESGQRQLFLRSIVDETKRLAHSIDRLLYNS